MRKSIMSFVTTGCLLGMGAVHGLADEPTGKKVFSEDFEKGLDRWQIVDPKTWKLSEKEGNHTLEITARESEYKPTHRSPLHIALIEDLELADFELQFRVRSTKDTGNHRDCCIFFNYQDDKNFYYVHLGALPDPASGQIMIVKEAPRKPLTENKKPTPWDDQWHQVKLVRDTNSGLIAVFFDDMSQPLMEVKDTTFGKGRIGLGSFDDMDEFDDIVIYDTSKK